MKIPCAVVLALAWALTASAQTAQPAAAETPKKALPRIVIPSDKPAATKVAPAPASATTGMQPGAQGKAAAKGTIVRGDGKKAEPKKDDLPGKIEGIEIPRGKGFLGIQIVDATFKLSFYDEKKKPVAADVDRAALRWDPKYKVGEERVVLTPSGDGKALASAKNIRPPYNFKLFITLIKDAAEGKEPVNETITVDFRQ